MLVCADLFTPSPPHVSVGLIDKRALSFSDERITLYGVRDAADREAFEDSVTLYDLRDDEASARKLAGWLGLRDGLESGAELREGAWSAWVSRDDGKVLEVACFGYHLFPNMEVFREDSECQALYLSSSQSTEPT